MSTDSTSAPSPGDPFSYLGRPLAPNGLLSTLLSRLTISGNLVVATCLYSVSLSNNHTLTATTLAGVSSLFLADSVISVGSDLLTAGVIGGGLGVILSLAAIKYLEM